MSDHLSNDLLIDYLRRELPPEDDAMVHAHLDTCTVCRREYEVEASLGEALRAAAKRDELEFPSLISANVWEAIRNAKPSPWSQLAALWRPLVALPVAAALVVAVILASPMAQAGPKIAAAYYLEEHAAQQAQNPLAERGPAASHFIETSALDSASNDLADSGDYDVAATGAIDAVR
jgi:anti-sigma factor RsiW